MKRKIQYLGATYVAADGVAGFVEDLSIFCHHLGPLQPQVEALAKRAKGLKLREVAVDLEKLLAAIKVFSKHELHDLEKTQEMPVAASKKETK